MDSIVTGVTTMDAIGFETLQAFSTYLHETVHWWQHMGSTSGLVLSLQYPTLAHQNQDELALMLDQVGPKKPIRRWAEQQGPTALDSPEMRAANILVNNATDAEYYKRITVQPRSIENAIRDRYFESIGHCYTMAYGHALGLLSSTADREFQYLPDARQRWEEGFRRVREARVENFVFGGPVRLSPTGLRALYEGQARFAQLQYLTAGTEDSPTLEELDQDGMLAGIYGDAFRAFVSITDASPKIVHDPAVALFMLILDLSINPTRGLPLEIENFPNFVIDVDPGIRFSRLCQAARVQPELLKAITTYSRREYLSVAARLTEACGYDHPETSLERIDRWADAPSLRELLSEKDTFAFQPANIVVRVLFSHFVSFNRDRLRSPEFFCWPGVWMTGDRVSARSQALFLRYLSLFTDKEGDRGIYPRHIPGVPEENLVRTLSTFYMNIVVYDLTRQWVLFDGPFKHDYRWLSENYSDAEMAQGAKDAFERVYGLSPDAFEVLTN